MLNYLSSVDLPNLLFGGTSLYSYPFDWDLGNTLALFGILGSSLLLIVLFSNLIVVSSKPFVLLSILSLCTYIFGGNMFFSIRMAPLLSFVFFGYSILLRFRSSSDS